MMSIGLDADRRIRISAVTARTREITQRVAITLATALARHRCDTCAFDNARESRWISTKQREPAQASP